MIQQVLEGPNVVVFGLCLVAWAISYLLAIWPSTRVYEKPNEPDWNVLRIVWQFLAAVLLPWLTFGALSGELFGPAAIFPIIAFFVFVLSHALTSIVTRHGPDAVASRDFSFWVRILREGETEHLIKQSMQSTLFRSIFIVVCGVVLACYLGAAYWAYRAISPHWPTPNDTQIAVAGGILFTSVAALAFLISFGVSWAALGLRSVSYPVRYGVAANSLQVFASSTWAAIFPWLMYGNPEIGINASSATAVAALILTVHLVFVFWPMTVWRTEFRESRSIRLREFRRIVRRIEVASRLNGPDEVEDQPQDDYPREAMRKAYTALDRTLKSIVLGSPFRAFTMLHINEPNPNNLREIKGDPAFLPWPLKLWFWFRKLEPRPEPPEYADDVLSAHAERAIEVLKPLDRHAAAAALVDLHGPSRHESAMNGYERLVHEWVKAECKTFGTRFVGGDARIISALEIGNPQLRRMVSRYRHGLDQTDYRYRLMYWSARLLSHMAEGDGSYAVSKSRYLNPLAHEILADLDELEQRRDVRSLVLTIGGVVLTAGFSLLLAAMQGATSGLAGAICNTLLVCHP